MNSTDLLATAKRLLECKGKPRQSDLRRAVSTLYYAMFHELAKGCADHLAGSKSADRSDQAWRQAYRALDHYHMKNQCEQKYFKRPDAKFPAEVQDFAAFMVEMQRKRHDADYDPTVRFQKSEVLRDFKSVTDAIKSYRSVALRDRRAFSIYIVLKSRATNSKKLPMPS